LVVADSTAVEDSTVVVAAASMAEAVVAGKAKPERLN
jgi:hypothetical protein